MKQFKALILILPFIILQSCSLFKESTHVAITPPQKIKKPTIQYQIPPKAILQPLEWDFPRTVNQIQIQNSTKCIEAVKKMGLDYKGVFDPANVKLSHLKAYCKIPAVDTGSNLYIGLTEANYRSLVSNYNILMLREDQWIKLLHQINIQLKLMNEGSN